MISKTKERHEAEQLRLQGFSYSEIAQQIPVTKSTLSTWLCKIKLAPPLKKRLDSLRKAGQNAGALAKRNQRISKTNSLKNEITANFSNLYSDPFFNFGLSLYWAEGSKQKPWNVSARVQFSNSDPSAIMIMRQWLKTYANKQDSELIYSLYIHKTADINLSRIQWSQKLQIQPNDLLVVIKNNNSVFRHNKDANYIGLIRLTVKKSTWLNRQISIWTELSTKKFLGN
ncbi:MAG: hypothetical protein Q7S57_03175 [bacterium]|nr:hypothetical protein [bacterium]